MTPPTRDGAQVHTARIGPIAISALAVLLSVGTLACGAPERSTSARDFEGGAPICDGGPDRPAGSVRPNVSAIGPSSNALHHGDDDLWIVESGANTVSTFDLDSTSYREGFVDVGNDRNPFEIAFHDDRAFISNWIANSVTVADRTNGSVLAEIEADAFDNPQGLATTERRLFVANVELEGRNEFGAGSIAVVDRASQSVERRVETAWKNPQYVRVVNSPQGRMLAVSEAGAISIVDGEARLDSPGGLELWPLDAESPSEERQTFELGSDPDSQAGAPGRPLPTPDGRFLYFTSATAPVLFKFDLEQRRWVRGISNPIRLYETEGNALHHGRIDSRGVLYVTAFNRDALFLFDTRCDELLAGPIDLGTSADRLEGPQQIETVERNDETAAYYITRSNALGRVRLDFGTDE